MAERNETPVDPRMSFLSAVLVHSVLRFQLISTFTSLILSEAVHY